MAGLLYKELILNRKNLLCIALGEFFASLFILIPLIPNAPLNDMEYVMGFFSTFSFFMMFLIMGMMASGIFQTDEFKKYAYFISSSPLTHTGQIGAKYLFTLLLYLALLLWCDFLTAFSSVLGATANFTIAFEMFWFMLIANAVEFPFIARFGSAVGNHVKTAFLTVVTLIAFEFVLFGNTEKLFGLIKKMSDASTLPDGVLVLIAAIPYFAAGLYFLSYKISCKLYRKGVEEYV
ncbi:MAG: ABC-2 transporter permease [Alistipes sp.]|nr:ABC-2 transporter permease [Alistipes sp.]